MILKFPNGEMTIDDYSAEAQKIEEGFDYKIKNNKIVFTGTQGFNLKQFKQKLQLGTATLSDIRNFILNYLLK